MISKSDQTEPNSEYSYSVASRMSESRRLQRPFLHQIRFGAGSVERKNVYKHLIRFLASTLNTNFIYYRDHLLEQDFSAVEIENIAVSLESVDKKEKQKLKGVSKDYANTIEMLCGYSIGLHTLRLALILWDTSLLSIHGEKAIFPKLVCCPKGRKISKRNIPTYQDVIKNLLDAIDRKLRDSETSSSPKD